MTPDRLIELLAVFPRLTIGLVGDLFLDRYLDIDPELHELSIETGLEAYQVTRVRNRPGALGTVINNLAALGVGRLVPATVLGDDGQAYDLLKELARLPVETRHILQDASRQTPTYTKPMQRDAVGGWRELNRLDLRNRQPLSEPMEETLIEQLDAVFAATDGLIVLDQVNEEGWGVVTPAVRRHLASLVKAHPDKLMFVDSRARIDQFNFGTLKPNARECLAAAELPPTEDAQIGRAAAEMAARTGRPVYCTLGDRGMLLVRPGNGPVKVPSYPVAGPIDTVGAGDSATSGIVATLLAGGSDLESAVVGNLVASITIQQLGTTGTASPREVIERLRVNSGRI